MKCVQGAAYEFIEELKTYREKLNLRKWMDVAFREESVEREKRFFIF